MEAIITEYRGATDTRGARIVARTSDRRLTVPYDYSLSDVDLHAIAACQLAQVLGWSGTLYGGSWKRGHVFVHPNCPKYDIASKEVIR